MGVAQKTTFSIDSSANSLRGDSGAIIEYIRSGIGFTTILPIFDLKTTSFPWPTNIHALVTKTTAALSYHQVRWLYFLAVVFAATIVVPEHVGNGAA